MRYSPTPWRRPRLAVSGVSSYSLTARAQNDLQKIFEFTIERFGERQAAVYNKNLRDCFQMLAEQPRMGRLSPTIRPGLRRHEHGSHVVIYKEAPSGVLIVALLRKRQLLALKL